MVLVWRIVEDSLNSPNFSPPTFPAIRYMLEVCQLFIRNSKVIRFSKEMVSDIRILWRGQT